MAKAKFCVINRYGRLESWTDLFDSEELADQWYARFGAINEARGHKLVKIVLIDENKYNEPREKNMLHDTWVTAKVV